QREYRLARRSIPSIDVPSGGIRSITSRRSKWFHLLLRIRAPATLECVDAPLTHSKATTDPATPARQTSPPSTTPPSTPAAAYTAQRRPPASPAPARSTPRSVRRSSLRGA